MNWSLLSGSVRRVILIMSCYCPNKSSTFDLEQEKVSRLENCYLQPPRISGTKKPFVNQKLDYTETYTGTKILKRVLYVDITSINIKRKKKNI